MLILRLYLEGKQFRIRTDQESLKWILILSDGTDRLARWNLRPSEFDFDVVHRAGIKHQAVNEISCVRTTVEDQTYLHDDLYVLAIEEQESGGQAIHIITIHGNEEVPLRAT